MDWDTWRANYPNLTYQDQQEFHSAIYAEFPEQRHFDTEQVRAAIQHVQPLTVVELGGWDGELAGTMLGEFAGIALWTNVEVCREASAAGEGRHPRYNVDDSGDWYWSRRRTADLLVASHVIEHLSAEHLERVIAATDAQALFFDAPLGDEPYGWQGFTGTHILEVGWDGVTEICGRHGYTPAYQRDHVTSPESGGWARACLYVAE